MCQFCDKPLAPCVLFVVPYVRTERTGEKWRRRSRSLTHNSPLVERHGRGMPKTDPTGRHSKTSAAIGRLVQSTLPPFHRDVQAAPSSTHQSTAAQDLLDLQHAAGLDDDLYFKVVPGDGGKAWHCFAYFKRGQWKGHYVYAVGDFTALGSTLAVLARKVGEVRVGTRRPTLDAKKGSGWQKED